MGLPIQKRWPKNAEAARVDTIKAAKDALRLLQSARQRIKSNPLHSELDIADAMLLLSNIKSLMENAKQGADTEDDE